MSQLPVPGDIIFARSNGFVPWVIRLGERLRSPLTASYWSHVAIMVEPLADGVPRIVEAEAHGVHYTPLSSIDCAYLAVPPECFPGVDGLAVNRKAVVEQAHDLVGAKYGWLSILSIVCNILTPKWLRFPAFRRGGTFICSAAGAWCLHAGGADIRTYDLYQITPAELYELAQ